MSLGMLWEEVIRAPEEVGLLLSDRTVRVAMTGCILRATPHGREWLHETGSELRQGGFLV
jgi:hypothetical protein